MSIDASKEAQHNQAKYFATARHRPIHTRVPVSFNTKGRKSFFFGFCAASEEVADGSFKKTLILY